MDPLSVSSMKRKSCVEIARFGGLRELRVGSEYRLFDGWILLREQAGCEEQVK